MKIKKVPGIDFVLRTDLVGQRWAECCRCDFWVAVPAKGKLPDHHREQLSLHAGKHARREQCQETDGVGS